MTRLRTWHLFAICAAVWGTTWHAITYQVGITEPAVGVALRFGLAGVVVLLWRALRGDSLRFTAGAHGFFALQGALMYGVSYLCVYHAERHLPSGLVSVGYSASPLIAGVGAHWLFGLPLTRRFVLGGVLGIGGVALIFWPEFATAGARSRVALGAAFTAGSVLLSSGGSLAASRNAARGLAFWPALGFGMVYGAVICALFAWLGGDRLVIPLSGEHVVSWWVSLLYLALAGSVLTFACFLTLQNRVGPGPTGAIGVMTPMLALVVSTAFEGYRPDWLTGAGVALAALGNLLMLQRAGGAADRG